MYNVKITNIETGEELSNENMKNLVQIGECEDGRACEIFMHVSMFDAATLIASGTKMKHAARLAVTMRKILGDMNTDREDDLISKIMEGLE